MRVVIVALEVFLGDHVLDPLPDVERFGSGEAGDCMRAPPLSNSASEGDAAGLAAAAA